VRARSVAASVAAKAAHLGGAGTRLVDSGRRLIGRPREAPHVSAYCRNGGLGANLNVDGDFYSVLLPLRFTYAPSGAPFVDVDVCWDGPPPRTGRCPRDCGLLRGGKGRDHRN